MSQISAPHETFVQNGGGSPRSHLKLI